MSDEHEQARVAFRALGGELVKLGRRLRSLSRKDFESGGLVVARRDVVGARALLDQIVDALEDPEAN